MVTSTVIAPSGVILTIESGTVVKFKHYRGHKEPWKKPAMEVNGSTVKTIGSPENQIWFSSDAKDPINGDWIDFFWKIQK